MRLCHTYSPPQSFEVLSAQRSTARCPLRTGAPAPDRKRLGATVQRAVRRMERPDLLEEADGIEKGQTLTQKFGINGQAPSAPSVKSSRPGTETRAGAAGSEVCRASLHLWASPSIALSALPKGWHMSVRGDTDRRQRSSEQSPPAVPLWHVDICS